MTSLGGSQNALWTPHRKEKNITPWSTQQKLVQNGKDTVMDVTYTVKNMQTPPVAVLVQPNSNPLLYTQVTQPILESGIGIGVAKKHVNRSHDNMASANIHLSPQNGLLALPSSLGYARTHDFVPLMVQNGRRTSPNPPVQQEIKPEHHSPKLSEARHISSQIQTTAEATTQALNATFHSTQGQFTYESLPHKGPHVATNINEGVDAVPSQTSALEVYPHQSNWNDKLLRLEHGGELKTKPVEQRLSTGAQTNGLRGQLSAQPSPRHTYEDEKAKNRYVFEAVVIDERSPHHTGLVSPKRRPPQANLQLLTADDSVSVITPGAQRLTRIFTKPRRPKLDIKVLRSEKEVEQYLHASTAPVRFATDEEIQAQIDATYTNVERLMAQWEQRPPVQCSSKAPSIVYPSSQPLERFVEEIESAFGPGTISRIPQRRPKRVLTHRNHARYFDTSSESEETEIEQSSDIPAEEDELIDKDTLMREEPTIPVPDTIQDRTEEADMRGDGAVTVNGTGTLKRKLSASGDEANRKLPKLAEDVPVVISHQPGVWKLDKEAVARWVTSLEVLIKGKVKLDRQGLENLQETLRQIYARKHALSVDDSSSNIEISHLKSRIQQLSEMPAEDIPFNDDENIRHLARMISRSWI